MKPEDRRRQKYGVIIPAYREAAKIGAVVHAVRKYCKDVIVVDDGSDDRTADEAEKAGAIVLRHEHNMGKGIALNTGFEYAIDHQIDAVITIDADGQHNPDEIPKFVEAYVRSGIPVLVGNRMAHREQMPLIRRWTNVLMSWMLTRVMRQYVPDTQCGFRLYRCDVIPFVTAQSERFAAESEILLNMARHGIRIDSVRISTIYGNEKSKIRPVTDTFRFFSMLWHYQHEFKK